MSIQSIEESKVLREYCAKLGREGVGKRIMELGKKIAEGEGAYQETLKVAGMIRALTIGCKWDSYWDEKQRMGYNTMYYEAKAYLKGEAKQEVL